MSGGLIITPAEFAHPMRSLSADEMQARGMCDIKDPDAKWPDHCSRCRRQSSSANPLKLEPVDRNPKALARAYLYRAICALGCSHA